MGPKDAPIAVVIPTRDRPAALARCLGALGRSTVPVEPIVIEDRDGAGPATARNRGIDRSTGPIVLFLDDDCVPEPDWAQRLAAAAAQHGCAAGRSLAPAGAGAATLASQAVTDALQLDGGHEAGDVLAFAPSCNLGCTRSVLERVRFDEAFPLAAGEDRDFCNRLAAGGAPPVYEPGAIVLHEASGGIAEMLRRQYRYGRGAAHLFARPGASRTTPGFRRRLLGRCFDLGPAVGAMALAGQAATATGYASERLRLRVGRSDGSGGA